MGPHEKAVERTLRLAAIENLKVQKRMIEKLISEEEGCLEAEGAVNGSAANLSVDVFGARITVIGN